MSTQQPTLEEILLAFLDRVTKATTITEVNVAAGVARNDYLGLEPES